MGWTPPTQHLRQDKKLLSDKAFYRKLSKEWNYLDEDATMLFYIGLVKLIGGELKDNKFVRLPHLGDMAMITQKRRPAWVGRAHIMLEPTEILKFYPKQRLRRYMRKVLNGN